MLPDYHLHTPLCRHATGAPADYRASARRAGLPEIAFSDHLPNPDGYDPEGRMDLADWPGYRALVRDQQDAGAPRVLFGAEADYYVGCEPDLRARLAADDFDLVIGAVHCLGDWIIDHPDQRRRWETADVTAVWRAYFELLGRLVDARLVDVVGHLDLPKKFGYRPPEAAVREMALPLLDRIASAGLAIEINTAGRRKPVGEIYPAPGLLALACERGIPICFGSDAHRPEEVGADFDHALRLARATGYGQAARFARRRRTLQPLPEIQQICPCQGTGKLIVNSIQSAP